MIEDNFLNLYMSKNHLILEGYAYAISASWYQQFQRFLQNPSGVDVSKFGKIENAEIKENYVDMFPLFSQYSIPEPKDVQQQVIWGISQNAIFMIDFFVVSIDVWHFLKECYSADYDVIVFVTKINPQLQNYFFRDNLDDGLCICRDVIHIIFPVIFPNDPNKVIALLTPANPWMDLLKFRTFIFAMYDFGADAIRFSNEACIFFNNKKKVPFKGNRLLRDVGITKDMQIAMSCQNLFMQDIEEGIETDGEEQQLEQNLIDKSEFLIILDKALFDQSTTQLNIKSIQEIQQTLEQNDFYQI